MKLIVKISILFLALFSPFLLMAQEGGNANNCFDGIDNDNDGRTDCYDDECRAAANCIDFYLNQNAACQSRPTQFPNFAMRLAWSSPRASTSNDQSLVVGDLDGDNIPEIVSPNTFDDVLYIINGADGTVKNSVSQNNMLRYAPVIANIDNDNCAEIFVPISNGIAKFDCNLNFLGSVSLPGDPGFIGIADFNRDGNPDIYARDAIIDARTMTVVLASTIGSNFQNFINSGPVAVDIVGDKDLELVIGGEIWDIDLNLANPAASTRTLVAEIPDYFIKRSGKNWAPNNSSTSVADYNLDGHLDVICSGADGSYTGPNTVFFWDVHNNVVKKYTVPGNWSLGTSRLNIGDFDGDRQMNVTFVSGDYIYALDENWDLLWQVFINEGASGITGTTIFDFNGDGRYEIVYRDEEFLRIIDGAGNFLRNIPCVSRTLVEYPIVADINGDGFTEICVPCGRPGASNTQYTNAEIRVFQSDGEFWMPSRNVWNQHGYFNVHVNDDLTIPREQTRHHIVFSNFLCDSLDASGNPVPGENRPLNAFLNQSPVLDIDGCPTFATPDIAFDGPIDVMPPICPDPNFYVSFGVRNDGDINLTEKMYVTFYNGDPSDPATAKLNTDSVDIVSLPPGGTFYVDSLQVLGVGSVFDLYISLNDPQNFIECDFGNNVRSTPVSPLPFDIQVDKLSDNVKCINTIPDNGSASAYLFNGTNRITAGYTFTWFEDNGGSLDSIYTGPLIDGMATGDYFVAATNDNAFCNSDTISITIDSLGIFPIIDLNEVQPLTSCATPNGIAEAFAFEDTVDATADYNFIWYTQIYVNDIGVGQTMGGLSSRNYWVVGTSAISGCSGSRQITINQQSVNPSIDLIDVQDITNCASPFGSMTAQASLNGTPGDPAYFTFNWFNGVSNDSTNMIFLQNDETISNLDTGFYSVEVVVDSTGCKSFFDNDEIEDLTVLPNISITLDADKSSCVRPNGALSASVNGNTSGYTFEWFVGNNTVTPLSSPATATGPNNSQAINLDNRTYTVRATDNATGCFSTASYTVPENLLNVTVSVANIVHQTNCWPRNGEATAQASGGLSGNYSYYWFDSNPGVTPDTTTADFIGSNYSGLSHGDYWVVAADQEERCQSDAVRIDINEPAPLPNVNFTVNPNETCNPTLPNGSIAATIAVGSNDDYRFQWYQGQTTNNSYRLPEPSLIPTASVDGPNDENLRFIPNQTYTLRIVNRNTNCNDRHEIIVPRQSPTPFTVNAFSNPVRNCEPPDGEVSADVGGSIANYTFNWFEGDQVMATVDFTGNNITGLSRGDYTVIATNNLNGCDSEPATVNVGYISGITNIAFNPSMVNSCIDPTGALDVNVTGGGPYDYEWFRGGDTIPANSLGTSQTINNVIAGLYTLKVVNRANGCIETDTLSITSTETRPVVAASKQDYTSCVLPYGSEISAVVTNAGGLPHELYWFEGSKVIVDYTQADSLADNYNAPTVSDVPPGFYTVIARQDFGNRCESDPRTVEVVEIAAPPSVTISGIENNNCLAPFDGSLSATASTSNGQSEPISGYNFNWYQSDKSGIPANPTENGNLSNGANPVTYNTANAFNGDLTYSVVVTNNNTQCNDTVSYFLPNNLIKPTFVNYTETDILDCNTGGIIEIQDMAPHINPGDYTFNWYESDQTTTLPGNGAIQSNLDSGIYYVSAISNLTRCESDPLETHIEDLKEFPAASLTILQEQMSLNPAVLTGELQADAIEQDGTASNYNFDWEYLGTIPATSLGATLNVPNDNRINLDSGYYRIVATNIATNCEDTAQAYLPFNPPTAEIFIVSVQPKTLCMPEDGGIRVDSVLLDGAGDDISNYEFYWYRDNYVNDLSMAISGVNTPDYNGLSEGTYFVVARHIQLHVVSQPYQVTIEDLSVDPVLALRRIKAQTSCDTDPANHNGELSVDIDNNAATGNYNISWYQGQDISGTLLPDTDTTATDLTESYYTINVENITSGCINNQTYYVPSNIPQLNILATTSPNRNCTVFNGQIAANLIGLDNNNYNFSWYNGNTVGDPTNPDFTGTSHFNLPEGDYTVVAAGIADPTCVSDPVTIAVENMLVYPEIIVRQDAPVTNCDPAIPNGEASVEILSTSSTYGAEWYLLPNTSTVIYNGLTVKNLSQMEYMVTVTDNLNNCSSTDSIKIAEQLRIIPPPMVAVSNVTNCEQPNGSIAASINGVTFDYEFNWYNGSTSSASPDYTGNPYVDLDIGTYAVDALHVPSGCVSPITIADVLDNRVYPQIIFANQNSTCELSDGYVSASTSNIADFREVVWTDGFIDFEGVYWGDVPAGSYQVTITTREGCSSTEETSIESDIIVYNGVSANGDGLNDIFHIDCIDDYSNNVKIFNRGGELVFEKDNYDNAIEAFEGFGNRGLYLGNQELPIGTYFYVITLKNTNKEPKTGYLELVR
jgi:large repetitive protein